MSLLGILPAMLYCADLPHAIRLEALSAEGRQKFNLLVQLVRGRALAVVRGVVEANGLECWRLLKQ
eukprot:9750616-Heterocapsa_arctica.AAC.1